MFIGRPKPEQSSKYYTRDSNHPPVLVFGPDSNMIFLLCVGVCMRGGGGGECVCEQLADTFLESGSCSNIPCEVIATLNSFRLVLNPPFLLQVKRFKHCARVPHFPVYDCRHPRRLSQLDAYGWCIPV